jgi:Right handed beta helix region
MARLRPSVAAALAVVGLVQVSHAATIRVPEHQPTIQAGINAAATHDTVLVRCGAYYEDYIVMRPGIVLRGEGGYAGCVLVVAQHLGYIILCDTGGPDTRIEGLTLDGGGAGLACTSASPTVSNCAFLNHNGSSILGRPGVQLSQSEATFTDCIFEANDVGLWADDCSLVRLTNCAFIENSSRRFSVVSLTNVGSAVLTNCLLAGNSGICVAAQNCGSLAVVGCTLTGNMSLDNTSANVSNSIIAFSPLGAAVTCTGKATADLRCCDVFGNQGGDWVGCIADQSDRDGNLSADPLFCRPRLFDYQISSASPCAAANAPSGCGQIGARAVGCSIVSVEPSTWGRMKAMWR